MAEVFYIRAGDIGRKGYKFVGPFATREEAITHKILMFPDEPCDKYGRIEQYSAVNVDAIREDSESRFVRPDSRQIAKFWKELPGGLEAAREFAREESRKICG